MFADTRSSIETICPSIECASRRETSNTPTLSAVADQRQRCRRAHLVGLGALAPGQRALVVQEIVADAYLPVAEGLPGRPRTPRAYRPRSKCRCCAGAGRHRHSRRRSAGDWFPAPAGRPPRPGSRRPRTRLRRPSRTVLRAIWRTESLRWSHSTPRMCARYRSSPSPSSLPAAPGCPLDFMRAAGLNARYWRPGVAIQSKCQTNEQRRRSGELRTHSRFVSHTAGCAGDAASLPKAIFEFCRMKSESHARTVPAAWLTRIFPRLPCRRRFESMPPAATSKTRYSRGH